VLALVVIGLQSAGQSASWGMQFGNPVFVVLITTLVTLVALNLFGVFEVTLSAGATGAASGLASRGGVPGAFFNGVFTTVLATPCTAPFLGVALGFAFSQPPALLLLMFLTAGLGLATPYLVLTLQPEWLKFLPRPGNWMVTFKMLMGFPMLGTVVWLLALAPKQFGPKGVFWLGIFLVLVALAAWLYGRSIQAGQGNRTAAWAGIAASLILGFGVILEGELQWRSPPKIAQGGDSGIVVERGIAWAPWSPAAIQAAQAEGRPVLVDFTADWCATCQLNKRRVIETDTISERLKSLNVVTLLGDHTPIVPAITEELRRFQRAGVPLVLVYPGRPGAAPRVLPELLTKSLVLEALDWAGQPEAVAAVPRR
ncbi:MAG: thioredoxin family protein, partial [Verrucomicrobiae bacterium]|nr:thioredoxin family protein [Verrucomicrobiae bacterium]